MRSVKGEAATIKVFGLEISRPFILRSRMPTQRVLECLGANALILSDYVKGKPGQQFCFDGGSKTIQSQQWPGRAITLQSSGGSTNVHMETATNSGWFQLWRYENNTLANVGAKVLLTVKFKEDDEDPSIGVQPRREGEESQLWDLVYVGEMPA